MLFSISFFSTAAISSGLLSSSKWAAIGFYAVMLRAGALWGRRVEFLGGLLKLVFNIFMEFLDQYQYLSLLIRVEMSLAFFSVANKYHKNGIWWFTKLLNRAVGEQTYDSIRVGRRIVSNKFYYLRQHLLYRTFVESPDVASMLGIYPKTDNSHGYGSTIGYEMYRDFQENTINSDGSFGMWTVYVCAIYLGHELYSYFIPFYWNKTATVKNGEEERVRLRDALSSSIFEDSAGFQVLEWGFAPHFTYHVRHHMTEGLSHPDDVRAMACTGLNRPNRYVEHYKNHVNKRMIGNF